MMVVLTILWFLVEACVVVLFLVAALLGYVFWGADFEGAGVQRRARWRGVCLRAGVVMLGVGMLGYACWTWWDTGAYRATTAFLSAFQAGNLQGMANETGRGIKVNSYVTDRVRLVGYGNPRRIGRETLIFPESYDTPYYRCDSKVYEATVTLERYGLRHDTTLKFWVEDDFNMGTHLIRKVEVEDEQLAPFVTGNE